MTAIVCHNCGYQMLTFHEREIERRLGDKVYHASETYVQIHGDLQMGMLDQSELLGFAPCQRCGQPVVFDISWLSDPACAGHVYEWHM